MEEMLFTLGSRAPSKNKLALYPAICISTKCPGEMGGAQATQRAKTTGCSSQENRTCLPQGTLAPAK